MTRSNDRVVERKRHGVGGDPVDIDAGLARPSAAAVSIVGSASVATTRAPRIGGDQRQVAVAAGHVEQVRPCHRLHDLDHVRGGGLERASERCIVALRPVDAHGPRVRRAFYIRPMAEALPPSVIVKPRLRGVSHKWAFYVSLVLGAALVLTAPSGRAMAAATVYAACVRHPVRHQRALPPHRLALDLARRWMRRLDHSAIFLLIAGSYTPFALLALDGMLADVILVVVWAGALGGIVLKLVWIDAPKWLVALIYVLLGWVAVAATPDLVDALGLTGAGDGGARRRALHGRSGDLRAPAARPGAGRVRLPRGVPPAGDRRGRPPVRSDRLLGAARRLRLSLAGRALPPPG